MLADHDMQAISLRTYFNRGKRSSCGLDNGALAGERTGFLLHRPCSYAFSTPWVSEKALHRKLSFREAVMPEARLPRRPTLGHAVIKGNWSSSALFRRGL